MVINCSFNMWCQCVILSYLLRETRSDGKLKQLLSTLEKALGSDLNTPTHSVASNHRRGAPNS
jgi:hypothetical protein